MTKIFTRIKFMAFASSLLLMNLASITMFPQKVFAAADCYMLVSSGGTAVSSIKPVCDINGDGTTNYYSAAGVVKTTPTDGKCYEGTSTRSGPSQLLITTYREKDCQDLRSRYAEAEKKACEDSDGSWTTYSGGGAPTTACSCGEGKVVSPTNKQCVDKPTPVSDGSGSDTLETRTERFKEGDCMSENGSELNGENCGIINLLNIIFNFVSGGVTLVVIGNIIVAGIQYSTAQGDPSAAQKAKTRIRNAVIAFIMYLSLYGFVQWLIPGGVFG